MGRKVSFCKVVLLAFLATGLVVALGGGSPIAAAPDAQKGASSEQVTARIDINKASEAQLVKLPGIGPAIAKRIVEFRKKNGPFRRVEDIMKVRGIGEKSFQKLHPYLTVGKKK